MAVPVCGGDLVQVLSGVPGENPPVVSRVAFVDVGRASRDRSLEERLGGRAGGETAASTLRLSLGRLQAAGPSAVESSRPLGSCRRVERAACSVVLNVVRGVTR